MSAQSESPFVSLIVVLIVGFWFLRRMGLFRGLTPGFWCGFWTRMFVGTLRSPTGSGLLEQIVKVAVLVGFVLIALACLSSTR